MQPNSSQMRRPAKEMKSPASHRSIAAPTLPTPETIDEGVEKIPVPMMRPMLAWNQCVDNRRCFLHNSHQKGGRSQPKMPPKATDSILTQVLFASVRRILSHTWRDVGCRFVLRDDFVYILFCRIVAKWLRKQRKAACHFEQQYLVEGRVGTKDERRLTDPKGRRKR